MKKLVLTGALMLFASLATLAFTAPAEAADEPGVTASAPQPAVPGIAKAGAALGAGLVIMGGGKSIGNIGSNAVQAIARQPEAGGAIFQNMIISAALIEGATLFAVVVTLLVALG